jgi:serine-type D-Ala-D-Ala carboxypeptidase (penicillin-binding protein 5/6)
MPTSAHRRAAGAVLAVSLLTAGCTPGRLAHGPTSPAAPDGVPSPSAESSSQVAWPEEGQASYALEGRVVSSPGQRPVPIASLAKVMTAYVTVHRLAKSSHLVVDAGDVADTHRRKARGESVVEVAQGEVLDRHQALTALLLPSANNVAAMLAERVAGSRSRFVRLMNETADALGMTDTTYTDPSGFAASTVSTARDQLLLLRAALRSSELTGVMGSRSAVLPVAGRVHNTNRLLGRDGFVAGKTGSTSAAGGCLVFRVTRGGLVMDGAVLGQRGGPLIAAGLRAATDLARQALAA